jgi:type IV pilus assembly protein PilY1
MFQKNSLASRIVLVFALTSMVAETARAGITDISNVPLATAGGTTILPNLLFDLDDSGSMDWDFMPDYVSPQTPGVALTQSVPCMKNSGGGTDCAAGDPPFRAGGANGFNGVAYDPNFYYRAGIGQNGQPLLNPPSGLPLGSSVSTTSVPDDVYSHNPYGSSTTNVNLATQIPDRNYCNSNSVCKRNGADTSGVLVSGTAYFDASNGANSGSSFAVSAGQFPYRTNPSNASTAIFGLPEMMSIGSFSRSSSTVTVTTVEPHGLAVNDWIYVTGTGTGSVDLTAVRVATVPSTTSFTYASTSSGTMNATNGFYRKHASATFTQSGTTVTVTSTNHGLVTNDVIAANSSTTSANGTGRTITVVDANTFRYTSATSATVSSSTAMTWVRTGLYNVGSAANGPAIAYAIVPVEYCSDPNLTNCARVLPGNTPPSGFTIPAYVRFCQTQAQALSPTAIGDASGTPRCRSKYNETAGIPKYTYPRYGWFKRDTITSSVTSYSNRPNRPDCAAAPTCTYAEELNNYARWYTYYRTRIQMMKSSVGLAFLSFIGNPTGTPPKPNSIRLGLITMHAQDSGSVSSSKYLRIADFDTTQAASFYDKFYRQRAANATPLQEALARAGWIFAGKLNTGLTSGIPTSDDPIQAACQRNFTLLTTDGYWNNLSSYPPKTPNGKTIGNLDQTPQNLLGNVLIDRSTTGTLDGTGSSGTTFTPTSTQSEQVVCQGNLQANFTIGGPTACGCQPTEHAVIQQDVQTGTLDTYSNGVLQSSTTTTNQFFTNVTGCVTADWTQADTPKTVTEDQSCRRGTNGSNAVFSDGSTNSCGACSTFARYLVIRQVKSQTQTIVTADGVQTRNNVSGTTTSYLYSTDGSTFSSTKPTGTSCATSAPTITLSPNPQTATGATTNTSGTGTAVAVWSPNPQTITGGTATTTFSGAGTASTVADVATYYFQTKLRGGTDVYGDPTGPKFSPNTNPPNTVDLSGDDVPVKTGARDFIPYQHMVTFGIGLADGLMRWQSDYDTANNGDFFNIKSGTVDGCFWATGSCNWPAPANNTSANLDDLWHAAVNGRGTYSQALNADALSRGISTALTALSSTVASAAASATSSPNVTQTDNQIFSTTYETNTWSGKVFAQTIDPTTGNVNPTIQWQADQNLLSKVGSTSDSRTIYTFDSSVTSTTHIKPFTWTSLTGTEQGYFSNKCTPLSTMSQCGGLTATQLTTANDGSQLLGYLRGWQAEEGGAFRDRTFIDPITGATASTVLGDTISAKPVFVRNPTLSYNDAVTPTYGNYATTNAGRSPRVYVAANDGYLHAFNGNTGDEVWAYVPGFLLPGMYALADTNYAVQHRFYVDGSPEAFDVYDATASAWKTIVIGGAGGGGRGFYALDVTDPSNPKGLWEFCSDPTLCNITDSDLGLGYGNPIVGKRKIDGKWVVVLSSGLNNVSPGTGIGYFYVLNVITGQLLDKVSTGVGDTATPSGLMKISAFYDSPATDATFQFVYGTDQLGNVWRLDVGGQSGSPQCAAPASSSATAPCVTHVATLKDAAGGRTQPITTRPALTHISANRVLYIGTGRYLGDGTHGGLSDLVDPGAASGVAWQQTFYGFKDKDVDYGDLRATANLVTQTLTKISTTDRGITNNPVDWSTQDGWLVDFDPIADPSPGERVNIDPRLVLGTLKVVTNIPAGGGACAVGGSSRVYDFDFRTGSAIATAPGGVVGSSLGGTIAVGMAIVQLPSGAIKDIITGADTSKTTVNVQLGAGGSTMRRFSYRER